MNEPFVVTVHYKGIDRDYEARLQVIGYTHRFLVSIENFDVFFERDEEGSYRAMIPPEYAKQAMKFIEYDLLQAIALAIESILA
ncbi:hypothetical protein ACI6Q2_10440 [Chitinophagaceae bacterium LWZ2-11]